MNSSLDLVDLKGHDEEEKQMMLGMTDYRSLESRNMCDQFATHRNFYYMYIAKSPLLLTL